MTLPHQATATGLSWIPPTAVEGVFSVPFGRVHGERGDVGRPGHAPDGERGPELRPARVELIAQ